MADDDAEPVYCPVCRRPVRVQEGRLWRFWCDPCAFMFRPGHAPDMAAALARQAACTMPDEAYLYD